MARSVGSSDEVRELQWSFAGLAASIRDLVRDIASLKLEHSNEIAALRDEIRCLRSEPHQSSAGPSVVRDPAVRDSIREEIRELHDRDKRRSSIVIRGLCHDANFVYSFNEVVASIWPDVSPPVLRDIFPIRANLVRATIEDGTMRRELLARCNCLKNSSFSQVFISRDLTRAQRQELLRRLWGPSWCW